MQPCEFWAGQGGGRKRGRERQHAWEQRGGAACLCEDTFHTDTLSLSPSHSLSLYLFCRHTRGCRNMLLIEHRPLSSWMPLYILYCIQLCHLYLHETASDRTCSKRTLGTHIIIIFLFDQQTSSSAITIVINRLTIWKNERHLFYFHHSFSVCLSLLSSPHHAHRATLISVARSRSLIVLYHNLTMDKQNATPIRLSATAYASGSATTPRPPTTTMPMPVLHHQTRSNTRESTPASISHASVHSYRSGTDSSYDAPSNNQKAGNSHSRSNTRRSKQSGAASLKSTGGKDGQSFIAAVVEGRGTGAEVGMCFCDLKTSEVILCQVQTGTLFNLLALVLFFSSGETKPYNIVFAILSTRSQTRRHMSEPYKN